jgi:PBS lyase HEAT-like repeat
MSKKNTPEKTRQQTLAFVAVFVGFLGTSIFAGINVFAAHQKNQDFSQLDAEEKFSRLPEYLLVDRKLLKDKSRIVQSIAAKALSDLQSKEVIPQLNKLLERPGIGMIFRAESLVNSLKNSSTDVIFERNVIDYDTGKSLFILKSKGRSLSLGIFFDSNIAVLDQILCEKSSPTKSFKDSILFRWSRTCHNSMYWYPTTEFHVFQYERAISQLIELLQHSDGDVRYSASHLLGKLQIKEAIPQLTIALNNSIGIEQYKILETLIILDGLNESQAKKWMFEMVKELEGLDIFSDSDKKSLAIDISTRIHLKFNQEHKVNSSVMDQSRRMRDSQWTLTGFALAAFLFLFLLTLLSLKELQRIVWKDHLTCYFPEEVVSELSALRGELTQTKKSILLVETTLLYVIFTLIWAFYIQINIENLSLPSKDQRRR